MLYKDRKRWLEKLKDWAVGQLPSMATPQARIHMRQSVEKALAGYGPQSPAVEVQDIVLACVSEAKSVFKKSESTQAESGILVERKRWINRWQEWAVAQLPSMASPKTRATLRRSVEEAFTGHGPNDSEIEIRDIVSSLVVETKLQLEIEEVEGQRASKKKELMDLAEKLLTIAIQRFPSHIVGEPTSWERHHFVEQLRMEFRFHLQECLTGEESVEDVVQMTKAFLGGWEKSSNTNQQGNGGITRRVILTALAGAAAAGISMKFPKIKEKVQEGYDLLRTRGSWDEVVGLFSEAYRKFKSDSSQSNTSG